MEVIDKNEAQKGAKLFTELRMAKKEEQSAQLTTREKAREVTKYIIESLKHRLNSAAGQRFAVVIDGVFPHTLTYGPRINHVDHTSFKTMYVGILSDNPTINMTDEPAIANAYEISTSKLFVCGKGILLPNSEFEPVSGLWLKYHERDHPSWDLTDIAAALAPTDIKEILKPKDSSKYSSEINAVFYIGNAEFTQYLTTLRSVAVKKVLSLVDENNPSSAA